LRRPKFVHLFNLLYLVEARNSYFGLVAGTFVSPILTEMPMALYPISVIYWAIAFHKDEPQMQSMPGEVELHLELFADESPRVFTR
jgi:coproporphyrinogen III oxidase